MIHLGTEGSDCGLFAIANAMGNYDTQLMRKYLAGCLNDKMMRHFNSLQRIEKEHQNDDKKVELPTANAESLKKAARAGDDFM